MEIKEKSITAIVGSRGKTNFLKQINDSLSEKNKTYMVHQNPQDFFSAKTVKDEIKKNKVTEKRVKDSLKMVCLNNSYLNKNVFNLSKGQQRLIALATLLAYNPKNVILDEPTKDLDFKSKEYLIKLIRLMKLRYKKTIIIASTDTDFLHAIADEVIVIDGSRIVTRGNKYQIFTNQKLLDKYNIKTPKIIEFSNIVKDRKNIDIGYRDDINDLMKDIYRYVN